MKKRGFPSVYNEQLKRAAFGGGMVSIFTHKSHEHIHELDTDWIFLKRKIHKIDSL